MKAGFINAYCHKPVKKYYSYHGEIRGCLTEPEPDPFEEWPVNPPWGPVVQKVFKNYAYSNLGVRGNSYEYVRNAVSANQALSVVGQRYRAGSYPYRVYRLCPLFNTGELPINSHIVRAKIRILISWIGGVTGWAVVIQNGMPIYPHWPRDPDDYNQSNWSGNGGSKVISSGTSAIITISSEGIGWINKGGITKFIFRSDRDIGGASPSGYENIGIVTSSGNTWLVVDYQMPL